MTRGGGDGRAIYNDPMTAAAAKRQQPKQSVSTHQTKGHFCHLSSYRYSIHHILNFENM
jgi:hypothetical protein